MPNEKPASLTLKMPRDYELGPAMARLNERQQAFVVAMIQIGGNHVRCALAAGYPDTSGLKVTAHRLAHDPKIQEAIREVGQKMMNAGSLTAVKFLLDTIENPAAENKDRLKATEMVLNRTGLHATSEQKVTVTHTDETTSEKLKRLEEMAGRLGLDAQKLLGGMTIEAEFEEVKGEEVQDDDLSDIFGYADEN